MEGIAPRGRQKQIKLQYEDESNEKEETPLKFGERDTNKFVIRESPLTELMRNTLHIRVLYHIFISILLILFCNTVIFDLVEHGKLNIGLRVFRTGFGDFGRGLKLWILDFAIVLAFYPALKLYELAGKNTQKYPLVRPFLRTLGVMGLIAGHLALMSILWPLLKTHLAVASSLAVTCEMFRFMMKLHAVAVACGPRCLDGSVPLPSFKHYVYFLFAPTLVYRDQYPRTKVTRWSVVMFYILELTGVIFYYGFLWERFALPYWSNYGKQRTVEAGTVVQGMFACIIPGIFSFLCLFYSVIHLTQNAFAEILRFGDRLFYEHWWTSSRFSEYYRCWNRIVHCWLRMQIFDALFPKLGRVLSMYIVFFVSAVAHEIVLAVSFGFFYPVLMIEFAVFGVLMIPLTATSGRRFPNVINSLIWFFFFVGNGLLWSLYPMEYFARQNCPPTENDNFFMPKSWSCPKITHKANWTYEIF